MLHIHQYKSYGKFCVGDITKYHNIIVLYCRKHYKEYLVFKVNQNHIDPLPLSNTGQLQAILGRDEVKVPDRQQGEGEEQYAERLRQV